MNMSVAAVLATFVVLLAGWLLPVVTDTATPFGVRVPETRRQDPAIGTATSRYHRLIGIAGVLVLAGVLAAALASRSPWIVLFGTLAGLVVITGGYAVARGGLVRAKRAGRWYADLQQLGVAEVASRRGRWLDALYALPAVGLLVATAVLGAIEYPDMPARLVLHFGPGGAADHLVAKSVGSAFALVFFQAFATVLLLAAALLAPRQRPDLHAADNPAAHARRNTLLARLVLLLAAGFNAVMLPAAQRIWTGARSMPGWLMLLPFVLVIAVLVAVALSRGRDGGARAGDTATRDDDRHWRGGLLYVNRADPAILVPKRVGVGWTLNFGNPRTLIVAVLAVAAVVAIVATARG